MQDPGRWCMAEHAKYHPDKNNQPDGIDFPCSSNNVHIKDKESQRAAHSLTQLDRDSLFMLHCM